MALFQTSGSMLSCFLTRCLLSSQSFSLSGGYPNDLYFFFRFSIFSR